MYLLCIEPKTNHAAGKHEQTDFGQLLWQYLHINKSDCSEIK
jgi:hypothetical protein